MLEVGEVCSEQGFRLGWTVVGKEKIGHVLDVKLLLDTGFQGLNKFSRWLADFFIE